MDALINDLTYALRQLRRSPGLTAVLILTLALGIGANTAVFSALDAALLRPLPVEEPERLVHLRTQRPAGRVNANLSYPLFDAIRGGAGSLSGVAAMAELPVALRSGAGAVRATGEFVSAGYFSVLGAPPAMGRAFTVEEHAQGAPVAVLGHASWRSRFGGDPGILGTSVVLNERSFTVVGVAPERFRGLVRGRTADFWTPLRAFPLVAPARWGDAGEWFGQPEVSWLNVIGRLVPDASLEAARMEAAVLDARLRATGLRAEDESTRIDGIASGLAWSVSALEAPLTLLMAVVAVVLLIACANVAGLLVARGEARRREIAIRRSLGADRRRLVRQLLTESLVVAGAGGAVGLLFALWLADLLAAFRPPTGEALALEIGLDLRVLGFAAAVSLVTALLFGVAPAAKAARPALVPALKDESARTSSRGRRYGLRHGLVVGQVALTVVLLVGAGLLLRSVRNLGSVDLAFDPERVLLLEVDLAARGYEAPAAREFYRAALQRVEGVAGVEAAAWASTVHPSPAGTRFEEVELEDAPGAPQEGGSFDVNVVSPGYFETLRMPLVRGRTFGPADGADAPRVAIINRAMAERYWPGRDPIGRRIYLGDPDDPAAAARIVGIAPDSKYRDLREAGSHVAYFPPQVFDPAMTLLIRTAGDPLDLAAAVRSEVQAVDPGAPVHEVRSLEDHVRLAASRERFAARLTAVFGLLALLLAAVGLYGVLAHFVARRTRELGVRIALGAEPRDVLTLVLRGALAVVGLGVALGVPAAVGAGRLAGTLLYGVEAIDPPTLALACATLAAGGLVAAWIPARRAVRVDPASTLRQE